MPQEAVSKKEMNEQRKRMTLGNSLSRPLCLYIYVPLSLRLFYFSPFPSMKVDVALPLWKLLFRF